MNIIGKVRRNSNYFASLKQTRIIDLIKQRERLTLGFSAIMSVLIHLVGQIFDFLVREAVIGVEDCILVRRTGQHALLLVVTTIHFLQTLFDRLWAWPSSLIYILRDSEIRAFRRSDNST